MSKDYSLNDEVGLKSIICGITVKKYLEEFLISVMKFNEFALPLNEMGERETFIKDIKANEIIVNFARNNSEMVDEYEKCMELFN